RESVNLAARANLWRVAALGHSSPNLGGDSVEVVDQAALRGQARVVLAAAAVLAFDLTRADHGPGVARRRPVPQPRLQSGWDRNRPADVVGILAIHVSSRSAGRPRPGGV